MPCCFDVSSRHTDYDLGVYQILPARPRRIFLYLTMAILGDAMFFIGSESNRKPLGRIDETRNTMMFRHGDMPGVLGEELWAEVFDFGTCLCIVEGWCSDENCTVHAF